MGRVAQIVQLCLKALDDEGERKIDRDLLCFHMNTVQKDIIHRSRALKATKTLKLRKGVSVYNVGSPVLEVVSILEPSTWHEKFEITSSLEWWQDKLVENWHRNPICGIIWDRESLELTPAPASDGEVLTLRVLPEPDEIDRNTEDPDISSDYDKALRLGVLAEVNPDYAPQFEAELSKQMSIHINGSGIPKVNSVFDDLGF